MKRWKSIVAVVGLGIAMSFTTGACGSGGSSAGTTTPADPLALLSGTYCIVQFSGRADTPDVGRSGWGTVVADGAGSVTGAGMMFENENGVVSGPSPNMPVSYSIDASRQLSVDTGGSPFFFGNVSSDGSVFILASVANEPAIVIGIRKSGTHSDGDLLGTYHLCAFGYDQVLMEDRTHWGTATFDGVGGGSTLAPINRQGLIGLPIGPSPLTYSVAPDGTVTGSMLTHALTGQIHPSGEFVTLAGATAAGGIPIILVLIKETAGASDATLTGPYMGVSVEADNAPPPDTWLTSIAVFTSDGAGSLAVGAFTSNSDGSILSLPPLPGALTYGVAGNGALTAGTDYTGGVSASGRFAMFAGGDDPGDDPEFWFLLR